MRRYIGTVERPRGSNRGGIVTESNILAVGVDGVPWCAAYLWRCWEMAARATGQKNPLWRTGSVSLMFKKAAEKNSGLLVVESKKLKADLVPRGTVFGTGRKGRNLVVGVIAPAHIGAIDSVTAESFDTVEGNHNDSVARANRRGTGIDNYIIYEQ